MKNLFIILCLVPLISHGQQAAIHFDIKNSTGKNIEISLQENYSNPVVLFGELYINILLTQGKTEWIYKISKPASVKVYYESKDSKKTFEYHFYLSPGDDLQFFADENNLQYSIVVKGKGSENNQAMIQILHDNFLDTLYEIYEKDTLPNRVFRAIKEKDIINRNLLKEYFATFHPTKDFIKNESLYVQYFLLTQYIFFKGNHKFGIRQAFLRNEDKWQDIEDSLIKVNPINNDEVLNISDYAYFLSQYILRTKERLWQHPELMRQYYETENDKKLMTYDPENLLKEKIINNYFSGKTAEYLYALIIKESTHGMEDNLFEIFVRFKKIYPHSIYTPFIEPLITKIEERRKRKLTDKMIFIKNTDSLQTFDDVLKLMKGKTVLLDMWGTWCSPCRNELLKNSDSIKTYFENKALDFLHIANYDIDRETKWKELISYYNLSGNHILANQRLTNDIINKVKGSGYPTYVIIKKDGTFELSEAGYPMKREILYKQIDKILNY